MSMQNVIKHEGRNVLAATMIAGMLVGPGVVADTAPAPLPFRKSA